MKLIELDALPAGLLDLEAAALHSRLDGPTLIHLPGERSPALFLSVLLHGNEPVGWDAVRTLLAELGADQGRPLPRATSLLIGNVEAARFRLRRLDHQPDFNRIWRHAEGPEADVMAQVVATMRERGVFLSVDIHNNTGVNPHYACVPNLDAPSLSVARRFSRPVVWIRRPQTVQAAAFAEFATALILEAGRPGERWGVDHARSFVADCMAMEALPQTLPEAAEIDLFHTVATVKVPEDVDFGFVGDQHELRLLQEFEHLNFQDLPTGTLFAQVRPGSARIPLRVTDDDDRSVVDDFFELDGADLRLRRDVVPSMFSPDARIIRQDCVCYLMERITPEGRAHD